MKQLNLGIDDKVGVPDGPRRATGKGSASVSVETSGLKGHEDLLKFGFMWQVGVPE